MSAKNSHEEIDKFLNDATVIDQFTFEDCNNSRQAIFHLSPYLWPRTPLGYRWKVEDSGLYCVRHNETTPVKHIVKVYGPDSNGRVNFITTFNGVNVQSFCFTRPKDDTYCHGAASKTKQENRYPPNLNADDFTADNVQYIRGHCIDYKDTIASEVLSSNDPINFIPEVPNPIYWNYFRNHWINEIRKNGNAYMQIPYYDDYSNFFIPSSSSSLVTTHGTYVPKGVFLTQIDVNNEQPFMHQFDVNWTFDFLKHINNHSGTYKDCAKPIFRVGSNALPSPVFDLTHGELAITPYQASHAKISRLLSKSRVERFKTDQLHRKAEGEIHTSKFKLLFACRLSRQCKDKINAQSYLKRAKQHAIFLESLDDNREIVAKEDIEKLKKLHKQQSLGFEDTEDLDFWSALIKQ